MNKLSECPFCGGNAELVKGTFSYHVKCARCGVITRLYYSADKAIEFWNTRKGEDDEV